MSDSKFEIKDNEGTLWISDSEVIGRGKIKRDGQDAHVALVKSVDQDGSSKFEMMVSCGLIYFNPPEEKHSENSPDYSGKVTFMGKSVRAAFWENVSQKGTRYISAKVKDQEGGGYDKPRSENEDIPF